MAGWWVQEGWNRGAGKEGNKRRLGAGKAGGGRLLTSGCSPQSLVLLWSAKREGSSTSEQQCTDQQAGNLKWDDHLCLPEPALP